MNSNLAEIQYYGLTKRDHHKFYIFRCSHCGNLQYFHWIGDDLPDAWKENKVDYNRYKGGIKEI